jgi:hypothetical protein
MEDPDRSMDQSLQISPSFATSLHPELFERIVAFEELTAVEFGDAGLVPFTFPHHIQNI